MNQSSRESLFDHCTWAFESRALAVIRARVVTCLFANHWGEPLSASLTPALTIRLHTARKFEETEDGDIEIPYLVNPKPMKAFTRLVCPEDITLQKIAKQMSKTS